MAKRVPELLNAKEKETIDRLQKFAKANNLDLFNVKGSLYQRVQTITRNNGMCPCYRERRPLCPCPESIQECKENGECGCRLLMAKIDG